MHRKENIVVLSPRKTRKEYKPVFKVVKFGIFKGVLWEHIELPLYLYFKKRPLLINFGSPGPLFYRNRIVTIHDISFYLHPEWFSCLYAFYYRFITPVIARLSKKIMTVSEFSKTELLKWLNVPENKVMVVHNAISEHLKTLPKGKANKERFILTVSSLDPRKNLKSLLNGYNKSEYSLKYKLKIAGTSSSLFNMEKNSEIDAVSLGYVSDEKLAELYKNANLFVYISLYEGFGIPPLEAMFFGCPVILSDIPVFREIFGDAAYYVDPQNEESISEGINAVLSNTDLRLKLIEKGKNKADQFSYDHSADKLREILRDVLN